MAKEGTMATKTNKRKLGGVIARSVSNRTPTHVRMSAAEAALLAAKLTCAAAGGGDVKIWVAPGGRAYVDALPKKRGAR